MKPRVRQVIVVEGRYDKNALLQVVDAVIVETGGFSVFHDGRSWPISAVWRRPGASSS